MMELKTLIYLLLSFVLIGLGASIWIEAVRRGSKLDADTTRLAYKFKPLLTVIAGFTFIACGLGLTRAINAENSQAIILVLAVIWWLDQHSTRKDWAGTAQPSHSKLPQAQAADAKEEWHRAVQDTLSDNDDLKAELDAVVDKMLNERPPQ